jgi:hypothetical protein
MSGIDKCITFQDYIGLAQGASNKVGILVDCCIRLHPKMPLEDVKEIGGRMAKLWVSCNKDTGYLLKLIWDSSSVGIAGSHLNYIQGMIRGNKKVPFKSEAGDHAGMEVVK